MKKYRFQCIGNNKILSCEGLQENGGKKEFSFFQFISKKGKNKLTHLFPMNPFSTP